MFFQKYLHNSVSLNSGKLGVLMSYSSDKITDDTEEFSKQIAMHIAATDPKSIDIDSLDKKLVSKEKEIFSEQLKSSGKPDDIIEKIVEGKVSKFLDEVCLLEQYYVMDTKKKVKNVISEFNNSKITILRFKIFFYINWVPKIDNKLLDFKNKHLLLKLSGEALMGRKEFGIDLQTISSITKQIADVHQKWYKVVNSCRWRKYIQRNFCLLVRYGQVISGLYWYDGNGNKFINTSKFIRTIRNSNKSAFSY